MRCFNSVDKMGFLNPFKRYTIYDFDSAFVPLAQAPPLHSSVVKDNAACCISVPTLVSETRADNGAKTVVTNIHPSTHEDKLKQQKTEHSFNSSTDETSNNALQSKPFVQESIEMSRHLAVTLPTIESQKL